MQKDECKFNPKSDLWDSLFHHQIVKQVLYALCNSEFSVVNGKESTIKAHAKGIKHNDLVKAKNSAWKSLVPLFFSQTTPSTSNIDKTSSSILSVSKPLCDNNQPSSSGNIPLIDGLLEKPLNVLHAEIRWTLKVAAGHLSFRSCLGLNYLFKTMFKDITTAGHFSVSKTK